jgi:hypothetical protein
MSIAVFLPIGRRERTMRRSFVVDAGLDKLQDLLLAMEEGDQVSVPHAVEVSGLGVSHCETVLEALVRAGLMIRLQGDAYVRTHLAD